jgi:predicted DNA-binding transcriptional regulator AlpA
MKKNGKRIRQALTQPGNGEVPQRFLSPEGICELLSISSRTLRRWVRAGEFPAPIRVGPYKATPRWSPLVLTDFLLSKHPPRQAEERSSKGCGDDLPAETGGAGAADCVAGIVQGGVIVPSAPLPEGMRVHIQPADSSWT